MTIIDQTIVALSAPTIESDLGLSHAAMQWAVNGYLIATAAAFLLGGRLADVFGHKRMVQLGIVGFGLTSLLCGLAPAGPSAGAWLITARAVQGVAGAIMSRPRSASWCRASRGSAERRRWPPSSRSPVR